jgi:tRNA (cytidine/uridine-2'-O-)-methyltransferase
VAHLTGKRSQKTEMIPFKPFNIVLIEPEIPPNTGNIARLCGATCSTLHLVGKLGFSTDDKTLKRAGLDYWKEVEIKYWQNLQEIKQAYSEGRYFYTSKKAEKSYVDVHFREGDFLVFGKETAGLPEELLQENPETTIRIPIFGNVRSINLATAAGIVLYEALRQTGRLSTGQVQTPL